MNLTPLLLALPLAAAGVAADDHTAAAPDPAAVAAAHGRDAVPAGHVFAGDITVNFGDRTLLDAARIHFHPHGGLVRIDTDAGTAVFDGQTAYVTGDDAVPNARFQLLTWPYFAVAAYKLDDGGTNLEPMEPAPVREGEDPQTRGKLTFDAGVGDAPDDWYVLYVNDDDQLTAMAYIVTYGKTLEQAEAEPHAIVYDGFTDVPDADGEPTGAIIATNWTFYDWTEAEGVVGEPIGSVTIDNLQLIPAPAGAFDKPEGATEQEVPAAG